MPAILCTDVFGSLDLYVLFTKCMAVSFNCSHEDECYRQQRLPGWSAIAHYAETCVLLPSLGTMDITGSHKRVTSSRTCVDWPSVIIPRPLGFGPFQESSQ